MLVKLSMVERAIRLSERCSTLGPRSSTSPPAMGSTAGRFTSGPCAPPRGSARSPTKAPSRIAVPTRSLPRSRPSSLRCEELIPAGAARHPQQT